MVEYENLRKHMVDAQIAGRGIKDARVLEAMRLVPRHFFLPEEVWEHAHADSPVSIGQGQTISQPYIVGLMTELLGVEPHHRVLDVGTGSGYQAAIMGELAAEVHTIERFPELAEAARVRLANLGYQNIFVHIGDGTQGFLESAPYDRIIIGAAAPKVPQPLLDQLAQGGRLVIPVGTRFSQKLEIWNRDETGFQKSANIYVVFVPLVGKDGWEEN